MRLIEEGVEKAKELWGVKRITTKIRKDNTASIKSHQKAGYVETGEVFKYKNGADGIVMEKALDIINLIE